MKLLNHINLFTSTLCLQASGSFVLHGHSHRHDRLSRRSDPAVKSISAPKTAYDSISPNLNRDGGGGGLLSGHHLLFFSDTMSSTYFVTNTIAYMDASSPEKLQDFGMDSNHNPRQGIPFTTAESTFNSQNDPSKTRYAIWPQGNLLDMGDGTGIIFPTVIKIVDGVFNNAYNTLVTVKATDNGPTTVRTVQSIFTNNEVYYGAQGMVKGIDGYVYLFGKSHVGQFDAGLMLARAGPGDVGNRNKYQYWNGSAWVTSMPSSTDGTASIIGSDNWSTGDIFWSNYYNKWLMVNFNNFADSTFYFRWSVDGTLTNWSAAQKLYVSQYGAAYNYAAHAYPDFDSTGKTLVLSYTYQKSGGGYETRVVTVEFA